MKFTKRRVLITALILAVVALAFLMGAYFGRVEDCCVSPQAQQEHWFFTTIKVLAAISGPIGGGIALWIAVFGDKQANRRFRIALRKDYKLDKKADDRQQAEWDRRAIDRQHERLDIRRRERDKQREFSLSVLFALKRELEIILNHVLAERALVGKKAYSRLDFSFDRPVYTAVVAQILNLPPDIQSALTLNEARFQRCYSELLDELRAAQKNFSQYGHKKQEEVSAAMETYQLFLESAADRLARACGDYLDALGWEEISPKPDEPLVVDFMEKHLAAAKAPKPS